MTPEKLNDESVNEVVPASSCQAKVDSVKTRSALVKWLAATGAGAVTAALVIAGEPLQPVATAGVPPAATMPAPTTRQAQLAGDIAPVRLVPPTTLPVCKPGDPAAVRLVPPATQPSTQPASQPGTESVPLMGKPAQIRLEK